MHFDFSQAHCSRSLHIFIRNGQGFFYFQSLHWKQQRRRQLCEQNKKFPEITFCADFLLKLQKFRNVTLKNNWFPIFKIHNVGMICDCKFAFFPPLHSKSILSPVSQWHLRGKFHRIIWQHWRKKNVDKFGIRRIPQNMLRIGGFEEWNHRRHQSIYIVFFSLFFFFDGEMCMHRISPKFWHKYNSKWNSIFEWCISKSIA